MELPAKAIYALVDIKKGLLSAKSSDCVPEETPRSTRTSKEKSRVTTFRQRHARSSNAFQRGCQNRAFWSPH